MVDRARFFETEALGLQVLGAVRKIGVPEVLGYGIDRQKGFSFLLLEYIESASRIKNYWETFGHQLAELHRAECSILNKCEKDTLNADHVSTCIHESVTKRNVNEYFKYGFFEDNFIGSNLQKNLPKEKWIDFYRECRLQPQIEMAEYYLDSGVKKKCIRLLDHLDSYLREPEAPSLLHGDLWSGNVLCGKDGKAWILDPAAYIGDFETDLAMTQLFGAFPKTFYAAYNEVNPIDSGYEERKNLYHLYHLLNHLNLFGRTYLGSVVEIINEYT